MPMSATFTTAALNPDERDLWHRVQQLWELSMHPDAALVRQALHPDYVGWDMNTASPHSRDAAVQSVADAPGRTVAYSLDPLSVRVYEGKTGVAHYRYDAVVESQGGQRLSIRGAWTEVYVKSGPRWLMVAVSGRPGPALAADAA